MADCKHGPRKRIVQGSTAANLQAGEHCPADDPACGVVWVGMKEIMAYWAAGGPAAGKPEVNEPSLAGIVSQDAASDIPRPDPSELPPARTRYVPQRYR
jgi:hypothetical protein